MASMHICDGTVYCESVCGVHDDKPNPYEYADDFMGEGTGPYVCPGPHYILWIGRER